MNELRHSRRTVAGGAIALAAVLLMSAGGATAARLVTSGQIANGTIKEIDLDPGYRQALKPWFAKVDGAGRLLAGRHVTSVSRADVGDFRVVFDRSVERCAAVASVRGTAEAQFHGFVTTYTPGGNVIRVVVRDPAGNPADGVGFNLVSTC